MNTISLVEDDVIMRQLLRTLLELDGFRVLIIDTTDIDEIILGLSNEVPNAILLDVKLRGARGIELNGMDVVKTIRANQELKGIKVLMASGIDYKEECLAAGADGFLLKPFMPDELVQWMKKATSIT